MKFRTSNFYLSVWLMIYGLEPKVEYISPHKAEFVFDITEDEAKIKTQEFYQDEMMQEFIQKTKRLKSLLYEKKDPEVY